MGQKRGGRRSTRGMTKRGIVVCVTGVVWILLWQRRQPAGTWLTPSSGSSSRKQDKLYVVPSTAWQWDEARHESLLGKDYEPPLSATVLLVPWTVNVDLWWTFHPTWQTCPAQDNQTHACFRRVPDPTKAKFLQALHQLQFTTDQCDQATSASMTSSGWGSDISQLALQLQHAFVTNQPLMLNTTSPWHYAYPKRNVDKTKPRKQACPSRNLDCYFLNLTGCSDPQTTEATYVSSSSYNNPQTTVSSNHNLKLENIPLRWYIDYIQRPQTWLRKRVFDFVQNHAPHVPTPCTVLHVRRNDIVLHGSQARKFHPIEEYLRFGQHILQTKGQQWNNHILLLTDDHYAIGEAVTQFPQYNWHYIDRPRFYGVAGWEMQIPSDDPVLETVVLLSIFQLVQQCHQLVHATGKFSDFLWDEMVQAHAADAHRHDGTSLVRVNIDEGQDIATILNGQNVATNGISRNYLTHQDPAAAVPGRPRLTAGGLHLLEDTIVTTNKNNST